jgi:hypothetical protein
MGERRVFFIDTEQRVIHTELTAKTALVILNKQARRNSNALAYLRVDRFRPRSISAFFWWVAIAAAAQFLGPFVRCPDCA